MRLARLLVPTIVAAAVLVGCGSSDESSYGDRPGDDRGDAPSGPPGASAQSCPGDAAGIAELRVTGVGCAAGEEVAAGWTGDASCASPPDASRFACTVRGYRCLGAATDRGIAVSCARPNRSIAFLAKRG